MNVSLKWLQNYFEQPLSSAEVIADALTMHVAEIEKQEGDTLEVKVLPDRAAYMLSHRGIAAELSAILQLPLKEDPLRTFVPEFPHTDALAITVDAAYCLRHMGALVRGVSVGPSPDWLREALEAVGQRSINNIVDATNYVMLNIGQPMHAFDADKIARDGDVLRIDIRAATQGETVMVLSGDEYTLTPSMYVIADATSGAALDIAGLKGGMASSITEATKDLFISVGNYDGSKIRAMAQTLKLFTDASQRYQNRPSPELVGYGMRDLLALIMQIAGGELVGVVDVYPVHTTIAPVIVSLSHIGAVLGAPYTAEEVSGVFTRLGLQHTLEGETFTVMPPFERRDLVIPEDLIEEVGRILGYEHIPSKQFAMEGVSVEQSQYRGLQRVQDFLLARGYTEIATRSFNEAGETYLANPLDISKPALRALLIPNMQDVLARGIAVAPRVLGPATMLKVFELGTVFTEGGEKLSLTLGYAALQGTKYSENILAETAAALQEEFPDLVPAQSHAEAGALEFLLHADALEVYGRNYAPERVQLSKFKPFSVYPFALRDVAVWTPEGTEQSEVEALILTEAGDLLARIDCFDRFEKEGKVSFAFRLVFESSEKTLSDEELTPVMERITAVLNTAPGFSVR